MWGAHYDAPCRCKAERQHNQDSRHTYVQSRLDDRSELLNLRGSMCLLLVCLKAMHGTRCGAVKGVTVSQRDSTHPACIESRWHRETTCTDVRFAVITIARENRICTGKRYSCQHAAVHKITHHNNEYTTECIHTKRPSTSPATTRQSTQSFPPQPSYHHNMPQPNPRPVTLPPHANRSILVVGNIAALLTLLRRCLTLVLPHTRQPIRLSSQHQNVLSLLNVL